MYSYDKIHASKLNLYNEKSHDLSRDLIKYTDNDKIVTDHEDVFFIH